MELKESLPRLEAWDADVVDNGWAIEVSDLHKWAETHLTTCSDLNIEAIAQYLMVALKELIEYTR